MRRDHLAAINTRAQTKHTHKRQVRRTFHDGMRVMGLMSAHALAGTISALPERLQWIKMLSREYPMAYLTILEE